MATRRLIISDYHTGVHVHRPVDQVQVKVVCAESGKSLIEVGLDVILTSVPSTISSEEIVNLHLGCQEKLLTVDTRLLDALSDLGLVLIDVCAVDMPVSDVDRVLDGFRDLSGLSLPCTESDSRDRCASVELERSSSRHFGMDG